MPVQPKIFPADFRIVPAAGGFNLSSSVRGRDYLLCCFEIKLAAANSGADNSKIMSVGVGNFFKIMKREVLYGSRRLVLTAFALVLSLIQPAKSGTFTNTGSMNVDRYGHSAVLLPSGKVLVMGGANSANSFLSSAELYDPATETWTTTGPMTHARNNFTPILLQSGKVLVAGGGGSNGCLSSAELYDPATETWTETGALSIGRFFHSTTLLKDGKVLVAGGQNAANADIVNSEVYNPDTETWTVAGALNIARQRHTGTLLTNGAVLVAGGSCVNGDYLSSAEVYDPVSMTWTLTGPMHTSPAFHTATLLTNGQVLIAGGFNPDSSDCGYLASAELFDPVTRTWQLTSAMRARRCYFPATLLPNGKVLVAGGENYWPPVELSSAEMYDPATGTWAAEGSMSISNSSFTATLLPSGKVLKAGGIKYNNADWRSWVALDDAEIYEENDTPIPQGMKLVSLDFNPKTVDISSGAQVITVTAHVTTDGAPFTDIGVDFLSPQRADQLFAVLSPDTLISSNANELVYQADFNVDRFSRVGTWTLESMILRDQNQNTVIYGSPDIYNLCFPFPENTPTNFEVIAPNGQPTLIMELPATHMTLQRGDTRPFMASVQVDEQFSGADLNISCTVAAEADTELQTNLSVCLSQFTTEDFFYGRGTPQRVVTLVPPEGMPASELYNISMLPGVTNPPTWGFAAGYLVTPPPNGFSKSFELYFYTKLLVKSPPPGESGIFIYDALGMNLHIEIINSPPFPITSASQDSQTGAFTISWFGSMGLSYHVQWKSDLTEENWTTVTNGQIGADAVLNWTDDGTETAPLSGTPRFYRITIP
jgi:hypothetical protein